MQALLPHYERELAWMRKSAQQFAQAYPRIASRLQLGHDMAQDPHVERLIESFALLAARVHKRLDDDFPLVTESLLEVLYPHYLRPFPSCSVARFELGPQAAQLTRAVKVPRGTLLNSRPVKGVACKFRSTQPLALWPVQLVQAQYRNAVVAPSGSRVPSAATSVLSITLHLMSPQARWDMFQGQALRVYLDGEASLVSALRETLTRQVCAVMADTRSHAPWLGPARTSAAGGMPQVARPTLVGFAEDEALLDVDARAHPAYRLLTEYFAFPEKFNFVDVPMPDMGLDAPATVTLHLLVQGVRADSDTSRLLESLQAENLQLGCTPVINLYRTPADPIRVTHTSVAYPVLVDGRRPWAHEVHSIDKVYRVRQSPEGEQVDTFEPFFSLRHPQVLQDAEEVGAASGPRNPGGTGGAGRLAGGQRTGKYWWVRRDDSVADTSPGHETELVLVDSEFEPAQPQTDTLSLQVWATHRDLPTWLTVGAQGGDLFLEGGSLAREIRLLRKPTATQRFERGQGLLWRLVSHLSLNHLSISQGGLEALQEMLRLYDLPRSTANARLIDGLVGVSHRPATAWLPGKPFTTFVRGTEVRLEVDESAFVGAGLGALVAVLDHFFGLYAHLNSFTQLTVLSARSGEVLIQCPPRSGARALL
jgi:type VI secretion system protein ImpG